jgi:hypothetical protein
MKIKKPYIEICTSEDYYLLINARKKAKQFNGEAAVIAELYSNVLGHVEIDKLSKIRINLGDADNFPESISKGYSTSRVLGIEKKFNFKEYFSLGPIQRKIALLEEIQKNVLYACDVFRFNKQPFVEAYEKVKEANYISRFIYKNKIFKNKDKSLGASLIITFESTHAQFSIIFYNEKEKIIKEMDCLKSYNNFMFVDELTRGGAKWIDNEHFVILNKNKQITLKVSVDGVIESHSSYNAKI